MQEKNEKTKNIISTSKQMKQQNCSQTRLERTKKKRELNKDQRRQESSKRYYERKS